MIWDDFIEFHNETFESTGLEGFEDKHPILNMVLCCLFMLSVIVVMTIPALIGWVVGMIGKMYAKKN